MGREKGIQYMRSLAKQNVMFRKGHTLLVTLCAAGEIPIVVVGYISEILNLQAKGAPVEWVRFKSFPTITTVGTISIISSAPHPNAAKLFYNFVISEDGANVFKKVGRLPAREGEQASVVKGLDLYVGSEPEFSSNYQQVAKGWKEIFGLKQ